MINCPVADLHCDLLYYLSQGECRTAYDHVARCSIPQMRAGHVAFQVLPVFTMTQPGSASLGKKQVEVYRRLPRSYPDAYEVIDGSAFFDKAQQKDKIGIMLAFENASGFCEEEGDLEVAFKQLSTLEQVVYISMTWNMENRFGGGTQTNIGIKEDGVRLLEFLHQKGVAIDLSHASDPLARDILSVITTRNLNVPVIASHSNFRTVEDQPRNLPDEIAKEILHRGGVIGLNLISLFVGSEENFSQHIKKGLDMGGERQLCFGADFFFEEDFEGKGECFFSSYSNAAAYPALLIRCREALGLSDKALNNFAFGNLKKFFLETIFNSRKDNEKLLPL